MMSKLTCVKILSRSLLFVALLGFASSLPACGKDLGDNGEPCIFSSDCRDSLKCVNERCSTGNAENSPCTKNSECDNGLKCVEKKCQFQGKACSEDSECAGGEVCSGEKCLQPQGNGAPCLDTKGCKAPLVCDHKGYCGDSGRPGTKKLGEACEKAENCQRGLACDLKKKRCQAGGDVGTPCKKNSECKKELVCANDKTCTEKNKPGTAGATEFCNLPKDCQANLTCGGNGLCAPQGLLPKGSNCAGNENCGEGLLCAAIKDRPTGKCQEPGQPGTKVSGEACEKNEECMFGSICGLQSKCTILRPFPGMACQKTKESKEENLRALFEVPREDKAGEFFRLPYPTNIRRRADGSLNLTGYPSPGKLLGEDLIGKYISALQKEVKGFSTNPTIYFRFSKGINFDSVQLNNTKPNVIYVNLDTGVRTGFNINYNAGKTPYICGAHITLRTPRTRPLSPNATYAVLLTNTIEDKLGNRIKRDKDFDAVIGKNDPSDVALSSAHKKFQKLREWLDKNKKDGKYPEASDVVGATVFTTHTPTQTFEKFRSVISNATKPKLQGLTVCKDGVKSPCESSTEVTSRKCGKENDDFYELHAKISLPKFQRGKSPYKEKDGEIKFKSDGSPELSGSETVCIAITVPKADMPQEGWPVLLYAHGTGGNLRSHIANGTAKRVNSINLDGKKVRFATVGIDQVVHGTRRNGDDTHPNFLFFNFANPAASLGNALQNAADQLSLVRWIKDFALASADSPINKEIKFNKDKVAFLGHSQGGSAGTLFLAYEPDVKATVFSGTGGGLIYTLLDKTNPINISAGVRALLGEKPKVRITSTHPVLNIFQHYFDRADPVNYGHMVWRKPPKDVTPKHILQTYGIGDTYTPENSTSTLAVVLGVEHSGPIEKTISGLTNNSLKFPVKGNKTLNSNKVTAVFTQYKPSNEKDGHFILFNDENAIQHFTRFLASMVTDEKGVPSVGQ